MTKSEIIDSLLDQALDRDSFVDDNDPDDIFVHDAKALREAAELLKSVPEWICVNDKLPEEYQLKDGTLINFLVYMPEFGVDVGNYVKPAETWTCMGIPVEVTHWMPLPTAPKEESAL